MEEKKIVVIRNFPVNIWQKIRQAAIGESKTVSQWLVKVVQEYLKKKEEKR